jgi:hypothetical protein
MALDVEPCKKVYTFQVFRHGSQGNPVLLVETIHHRLIRRDFLFRAVNVPNSRLSLPPVGAQCYANHTALFKVKDDQELLCFHSFCVVAVSLCGGLSGPAAHSGSGSGNNTELRYRRLLRPGGILTVAEYQKVEAR